jgi:dihydrofolate reductase
MAKLIYITNVSLDGFIEDAGGSFDFTEPDEEGFAFITDLVRSVDTWLYGRRLYETMAVWETDPSLAAQSEPMADFATVWQGGRRSCTPRPCRRCRRPGLGSSAASTRTQYGT